MRNLFFFSFLLEQSLLDLSLLFFSDFDHDLLHSLVHLLAVFLSGEGVAVDPGVLHDLAEGNAFFGIGVEHFLDEVWVGGMVPLKSGEGVGFPEKMSQNFFCWKFASLL